MPLAVLERSAALVPSTPLVAVGDEDAAGSVAEAPRTPLAALLPAVEPEAVEPEGVELPAVEPEAVEPAAVEPLVDEPHLWLLPFPYACTSRPQILCGWLLPGPVISDPDGAPLPFATCAAVVPLPYRLEASGFDDV
ncbi:MAG: hypothetical protein ACRDLE_07535, partial [Gaiellaceae bacterium]